MINKLTNLYNLYFWGKLIRAAEIQSGEKSFFDSAGSFFRLHDLEVRKEKRVERGVYPFLNLDNFNVR